MTLGSGSVWRCSDCCFPAVKGEVLGTSLPSFAVKADP